jgi:hypothetical protein
MACVRWKGRRGQEEGFWAPRSLESHSGQDTREVLGFDAQFNALHLAPHSKQLVPEYRQLPQTNLIR